ncbi:MAG: nitroreductase family deazaflavin-dependent oxidoreductase [Acidimicrobiia bacterium]
MDEFPAAFADLDCCDITTTGRRSGRLHRIEIWFAVEGSTLYVISGNGPGAHWFQNLVAEPSVVVELGGQVRRGRARVVDDAEERHRLGEALGRKYPSWQGDPAIGLTREAWCFDVPLVAIDDWVAVA